MRTNHRKLDGGKSCACMKDILVINNHPCNQPIGRESSRAVSPISAEVVVVDVERKEVYYDEVEREEGGKYK